MTSLISFLIVIAICVISHEGGHFLAAVWRNVLVHEFSFGMGPEICSRQRGETKWSFRAYPIGGYVKLDGEDEDGNEEPKPAGYDPSRALNHKKPWERLVIIAAGASVNLLLAWLLTAAYLAGYGVYDLQRPAIGMVMPDTPAMTAGLRTGDLIRSINGVQLNKWSDIRSNIHDKKTQDDKFTLVIERGGAEQTLELNIPVNKKEGGRLLGVQPSVVRYPIWKALSQGLVYSWNGSVMLIKGLWMMITGQIKADVAGPVGIAVLAGDAFRQGFWTFIAFLGMMNLNLGLLNLLPFPALDGGRIFFILIEIVTRHKVPERWESRIHYGGMVALIALILLVTGKDILRLVGGDNVLALLRSFF